MEDRKITVRYGKSGDVGLVYKFLKGLAEYEEAEDIFTVDEETLESELFERKQAEVIFVMVDEKEVGMALFFQNFVGYTGCGGLFLDSFFVEEEYRGMGCGKALFEEMRRIARERGGARIEWICLDWNQSSIDFYLAQGAKRLDTCRTYRLTI